MWRTRRRPQWEHRHDNGVGEMLWRWAYSDGDIPASEIPLLASVGGLGRQVGSRLRSRVGHWSLRIWSLNLGMYFWIRLEVMRGLGIKGSCNLVIKWTHTPSHHPVHSCSTVIINFKSVFSCSFNIRKLGRHWYDQTVMTRTNLVDTMWYFLIYNYHQLKLCQVTC